jgi:hypothetical protein
MRLTAARRALATGILLVAIGAATASVAHAASKPSLSAAKARALVAGYVKQRSEPELHTNNPNGAPGNFGVVASEDCERVSRAKVRCAWGIFWPNGHQVFNLREVTATRQGSATVYVQRNVFPADAVDEDGSGNGGSHGRGTATDIDPEGRGPLGGDDDGEL